MKKINLSGSMNKISALNQKDFAVMVIVIVVSCVVSFIISSKLISTPAHRQQSVETVPTISGDFSTPDSKYLNPTMLNPTKPIRIGNNSNPAPFNGSSSSQ